jgi:hypothetical protein
MDKFRDKLTLWRDDSMRYEVLNGAEHEALKWIAAEMSTGAEAFEVEAFRDAADVGWIFVTYRHELTIEYWVVSPRGRVWLSDRSRERLQLLRDLAAPAFERRA